MKKTKIMHLFHVFMMGCALFIFEIKESNADGPKKADFSTDAIYRSKAKIHFDNYSHDFGRVKRGEKLTYRFKFKNVGQDTLVLQGVHASCGCLVADVDTHKNYGVGEEGYVEVTFDTTNFKHRVSKVVTVMTNEARSSSRNLTISANIDEDIFSEPPIVDFGDVNSSQEVTQVVKVQTDKSSQVNVTGMKYKNEALDVGYVKESENKWNVTVKLKPHIKTGFFKDTIYVQNTSGSLKELPILVRANIKGDVQYTPNYLEFGAIPLNHEVTRRLSLESGKKLDLMDPRIDLTVNGDKLKDPSNFLKIKTEYEGEKQKKLVVSLLNAAKKTGSVHGRLVFETKDPLQKEITVDLYGFFQ